MNTGVVTEKVWIVWFYLFPLLLFTQAHHSRMLSIVDTLSREMSGRGWRWGGEYGCLEFIGGSMWLRNCTVRMTVFENICWYRRTLSHLQINSIVLKHLLNFSVVRVKAAQDSTFSFLNIGCISMTEAKLMRKSKKYYNMI